MQKYQTIEFDYKPIKIPEERYISPEKRQPIINEQ